MFHISLPETHMPPCSLALTDQCARLRDAAMDVALRDQSREDLLAFGRIIGRVRVDYRAPFEATGEHDLVLKVPRGDEPGHQGPIAMHIRWSDDRFDILQFEAGPWEDELMTLAESYGLRCYHCGELTHH